MDLCSIYETTIERMLHEYDFGIKSSPQGTSTVSLYNISYGVVSGVAAGIDSIAHREILIFLDTN